MKNISWILRKYKMILDLMFDENCVEKMLLIISFMSII